MARQYGTFFPIPSKQADSFRSVDLYSPPEMTRYCVYKAVFIDQRYGPAKDIYNQPGVYDIFSVAATIAAMMTPAYEYILLYSRIFYTSYKLLYLQKKYWTMFE